MDDSVATVTLPVYNEKTKENFNITKPLMCQVISKKTEPGKPQWIENRFLVQSDILQMWFRSTDEPFKNG